MLSRFEETVIIGDPKMRDDTPAELREIQMVYRREQARQLCQQLEGWGLEPNDLEFYPAEFEKNICPNTGLESESGIVYNRRTGVSVAIALDWVCQWNCSKAEWSGAYKPALSKCKPRYFFIRLGEDQIEQLRTPGKTPRRYLAVVQKPEASGWSDDDWNKFGSDW
jgi:hypothetical protein